MKTSKVLKGGIVFSHGSTVSAWKGSAAGWIRDKPPTLSFLRTSETFARHWPLPHAISLLKRQPICHPHVKRNASGAKFKE